MRLSLIVATGRNGEIGQAGKLPWLTIPEDLAWFKKCTMGKPVLMGRKTWESLPDRYRPLEGRDNIVVTRDATFYHGGRYYSHAYDNLWAAGSLDHAIELASELPGYPWDDTREAVVIGGRQIYEATLPQVTRVYFTMVDAEYPGADTFFPLPVPLLSDDWTTTYLHRAEPTYLHRAETKHRPALTFAIFERRGDG